MLPHTFRHSHAVRGAVILGAPTSARFSNPNLGHGSSCAEDQGGSMVVGSRSLEASSKNLRWILQKCLFHASNPSPIMPSSYIEYPQSKPWWNVLDPFMTRLTWGPVLLDLKIRGWDPFCIQMISLFRWGFSVYACTCRDPSSTCRKALQPRANGREAAAALQVEVQLRSKDPFLRCGMFSLQFFSKFRLGLSPARGWKFRNRTCINE